MYVFRTRLELLSQLMRVFLGFQLITKINLYLCLVPPFDYNIVITGHKALGSIIEQPQMYIFLKQLELTGSGGVICSIRRVLVPLQR